MTGLLAHPFGTCQGPGCGKPLPPPVALSHWRNRSPQKYCSNACRCRGKRRRIAAARARAERCPDCGAGLGADSSLLYCRARCGWDELLTAHERDPRADCDTPDDEAAE